MRDTLNVTVVEFDAASVFFMTRPERVAGAAQAGRPKDINFKFVHEGLPGYEIGDGMNPRHLATVVRLERERADIVLISFGGAYGNSFLEELSGKNREAGMEIAERIMDERESNIQAAVRAVGNPQHVMVPFFSRDIDYIIKARQIDPAVADYIRQRDADIIASTGVYSYPFFEGVTPREFNLAESDIPWYKPVERLIADFDRQAGINLHPGPNDQRIIGQVYGQHLVEAASGGHPSTLNVSDARDVDQHEGHGLGSFSVVSRHLGADSAIRLS